MGAPDLDEPVVLDEFGILRVGDGWVALSPVQEELMRVFLARDGAPVARTDLAEAAWPGGQPFRALDMHMTRLRARVAPLGLAIVTIRGRGFVLTRA